MKKLYVLYLFLSSLSLLASESNKLPFRGPRASFGALVQARANQHTATSNAPVVQQPVQKDENKR